MHEAWAAQVAAEAAAYWTEARTRELTGGKQLAILPAEAPVLLRALGLLHRDATMPPAQVRKYLQINHVVRVMDTAMAALRARHPVIRILDAGCGRSYLTLLLAWVARERWHHQVEVLGVDRNPAVIAECERRTAIAGLADVVRFRAANLADLVDEPAHAVFALHACDTATDDAIALGVATRAELIAVAPCCQAELARAWAELGERGAVGGFAPIWTAPHLRRETAAHVTDAMRVALMRAAGYEVTPMEFIGLEHTKKNTLIRGMRVGPGDPAARAAYDALVAATGGCGIGLGTRI
ncbi:MAG: SAM-dependent methyltransferase [Proteobacteria bacterium]|nr:SAM-dependent methyltransferase [Pseudomonadota bacterium]